MQQAQVKLLSCMPCAECCLLELSDSKLMGTALNSGAFRRVRRRQSENNTPLPPSRRHHKSLMRMRQCAAREMHQKVTGHVAWYIPSFSISSQLLAPPRWFAGRPSPTMTSSCHCYCDMDSALGTPTARHCTRHGRSIDGTARSEVRANQHPNKWPHNVGSWE
jgi:hypothetical protein